LLVFNVGCDSAFETPLSELNNDPTALTEVELRLMLPEIIAQSMYNEGATGARAIGIIMQQFIGLDAQQLQYTDYVMGEDLLNNYWRTGLYSGVLRSCDVLMKQAEAEGNNFYKGVAKVIMANQYGIATSWFGDMPFTEALKGLENPKPAYDSQESIYGEVIKMLDSGISDLNSASDVAGGGGDLIHNGIASAWVKTAQALKARFLFHTAKQNNGNYAAALAALSSSYGSAAEQSNFTFGTAETQNYSLAKFGAERPSTLGIDPRFAAMMDGDPRQSKYMVDPTGVPLYHNGTSDLPWARNDATVPMISYAEVKFMEAEAQERAGGDGSGALEMAILANCAQVGVAAADAATYASSVVSGNVDVNTVLTEAYKAYYGQAFHTTFANWRRTGVPSLTPSSNGMNGFNPSGGVPVRFLYVESETQTNSENVAAARDRQGGGLLDAALWAFK